MLYLVPFARARREMADRQSQPGLVGQSLQLPFPQPQTPAVAATAISGDQQPPGAQIQAAALGAPPTADRATANAPVSWSVPTLTKPALRPRS